MPTDSSNKISLVSIAEAIQAPVTQPSGVITGFVRHGLMAYARRILGAAPGDLLAAGRPPHEWKSCAAMVLRTLRNDRSRFMDMPELLRDMSGRAKAAERFVVRAILAYASHIARSPPEKIQSPVRGISSFVWRAIASDIEAAIELIVAFQDIEVVRSDE